MKPLNQPEKIRVERRERPHRFNYAGIYGHRTARGIQLDTSQLVGYKPPHRASGAGVSRGIHAANRRAN